MSSPDVTYNESIKISFVLKNPFISIYMHVRLKKIIATSIKTLLSQYNSQTLSRQQLNQEVWDFLFHDDVIKWKHFPRYRPFVKGIHRWLVDSLHKGQWRGALFFSMICDWTNGWTNNRDVGFGSCHRARYDFIVMYFDVLWYLAFQISFAEWPSDIFHGDFYDTYVARRPYEYRYAALRTSDPNNISNSDLHMMERLVKKNFLSAYILGSLNVKEIRDTPKMTQCSFISQLGAIMNLWAGITVVVIVEIIEFFYDAICRRWKTNKTAIQENDCGSVKN